MLIYGDSVILDLFLRRSRPFNARAVGPPGGVVGGRRYSWPCSATWSRLECRMLAHRLGATQHVWPTMDAFHPSQRRLAPITAAVFDRATLIRATHNFKLADCLHLAAAVEARCDRFLTNDVRLSAFTALPVEVLP